MLPDEPQTGSPGPSTGTAANQPPRERARPRAPREELNTIPEAVKDDQLVATPDPTWNRVNLLSNFVEIRPMEARNIFKYRAEFDPDIENTSFRRRIIRQVSKQLFEEKYIFDGVFDLVSSVDLNQETTETLGKHPTSGEDVKIILKKTGIVFWNSFEMLRIYSTQMKDFLRRCNFFEISKSGAHVHPELASPLGADLLIVRGYNTGADLHSSERKIYMNLEAIHKIMQVKNVLQYMSDIRNANRSNFKPVIEASLIGKQVVTSYNKIVYIIESIRYDVNPESTFTTPKGDISYCTYFLQKYGVEIREKKQPLLSVTPSKRSDRERQQRDGKDILLVPEMCNIAGLTKEQQDNTRLRNDLVRISQVKPQDRVKHMEDFMKMVFDNNEVQGVLNRWGYEYAKEPVKTVGFIFPVTKIGLKSTLSKKSQEWPPVDQQANFDNLLKRDGLAVTPETGRMLILIPRSQLSAQKQLLGVLRTGLERCGLYFKEPTIYEMEEGESARNYVQALSQHQVKDYQIALVIINRQGQKEIYDAVKKQVSVSMGLISQCVTAQLLKNEKRASSAAVKIGIQIAAKIGGEPWRVAMPSLNFMICGYDTYHDTANRSVSYGAFVASMNSTYTKWYSKADLHDRLDELSAHLSSNITEAIKRWSKANGENLPERIIIYRDGVGDGQLGHVFNQEIKDVREAIAAISESIDLTVIVVNKRVGARFYAMMGKQASNPAPGTIIAKDVKRSSRYDFYLVSTATHNGTVTPTYYNILWDDKAAPKSLIRWQRLTYCLCFLYFNWSGAVRVPAPCQYAHKLALLCGENLHAVPNGVLDDHLHFL